MANELRELEKILEDAGFTFLRKTGKHRIYVKGVIKMILPTGSVGSHRFRNYLKQQIRHAELRHGVRKTLKG